jgi:copper(I)-binding protein
MSTSFMIRLAALATAGSVAVALAATSAAATADAPMISGAWARATGKGQETSAAYFVIKGMGTADRLVAAAAPASVAMTTQLHKTVMGADGKMRMKHVMSISVPANGVVILEPGGFHVMLLKLRKQLVAGSSIRLTLTFAKAGKQTVRATVRKVGSMPGTSMSGNG